MSSLVPLVSNFDHFSPPFFTITEGGGGSPSLKIWASVQEKEKQYGTDKWQHALKRESNWLPYLQLIPTDKDAHIETVFTRLRGNNDADELIAALAQFFHVSDADVCLLLRIRLSPFFLSEYLLFP